MSPKFRDIANVKTFLFLLSELIWIKGNHKASHSLEEIVNANPTLSVLTTQYLHYDMVLFHVNLRLMMPPALLLRCGHVWKNLLGDGRSEPCMRFVMPVCVRHRSDNPNRAHECDKLESLPPRRGPRAWALPGWDRIITVSNPFPRQNYLFTS